MTTEPPTRPPTAPPNGMGLPPLTDDALAEVRKMFTAEQYEKTKSFVTMFCSAQGGSSLRAVAVAQSLTRSMSVPNEAPAPVKPPKQPSAQIKREPTRASMTREFENASSAGTPVIPSPASDSSGFGRNRISLNDAADQLAQREREKRKEKKRKYDESIAPLAFPQPQHHQPQPQYAPTYALPNPAIKVEPPTYTADFFTQPPMPTNPQHTFKRSISDTAAYQRPMSTMERFMEERERREVARTTNFLRPGIPTQEEEDDYSHSAEPDSPTPSPAMSYADLPTQHQQLQFPYQQFPAQDMSSLYAPAYASHMASMVTPQKNVKSIPPTSSPYHPDQATPAPFPVPTGPRPSTKPAWSYAALIGQSINAAPSKRASLSQIYNWISTAYPFYKRSEAGWQNSIRHNLSLNECFVKIKREEGEKGKGCWWGIRPGDEECFAAGGFRKKGALARAPSSAASSRRNSDGESRKRKAHFDYDDSEDDSSSSRPAKRPAPRKPEPQQPIMWAVPESYNMQPPTSQAQAQQPQQSTRSQTPVRAVSPLPHLSQQFPNMPGLTPSVSSPPSSSPMMAMHHGNLPPGYSVPSKLSGLQPNFELSPKGLKGKEVKPQRIPLQPKLLERLEERQDAHGMSPFSFLTQSVFREISPNAATMPLPALPKTSTFTNMGPPATPKRPRTPPSKVSEIIANPSRSDRRLPTIPGLQEALSTPPGRKLLAYDELQMSTPSRMGGSSSHVRSASASGIFPAPSPFGLNSTPSRGVFGSPGGSSLFGTPLGRALAQKWDMSDPATQANEDLQLFISSGTKLGLFESPVRGSGTRSGWDSPGFDNW
ncbi:hypothetical protein CALVIDRAFT_559470 [Calocera viscosa TUFC12733]|uniref:Fork-head domain-containing protein n=1 Tax=Calocera viscosa (strain TUFC12733) TaxID=1330018 RepID=A0A167S8C2_CALVF|nr:hypothetical protein CALVIDRAFT_559470 [Calocera viscosa TUFC12733]